MLKAEVVKSGDSQMVRLPSDLHLDVDSVYVNKLVFPKTMRLNMAI